MRTCDPGTVEVDEFHGWLTVNNYPIIDPTGPFKRGVLPTALFIEASRSPSLLGGLVKGTERLGEVMTTVLIDLRTVNHLGVYETVKSVDLKFEEPVRLVDILEGE